MHNQKKWIVAYDGTIKRSRNRAEQDRLRGMTWSRFHRMVDACEECQRGWRSWRVLYCSEHEFLNRVMTDPARYDRTSRLGRGTPPRWWRRMMNRAYKRRMKALVRAGRDEECHGQKQEGAWYW